MTSMNHENDRIVLNQPNIESMKPKPELVFMSDEYEDIEELTEEVRLWPENFNFRIVKNAFSKSFAAISRRG